MAVDDSVTVKGSPVRSLQKFIDAQLSPEQREKGFAALRPENASRFRSPFLAPEPVPVHMRNVSAKAPANVFGEPVETFARRAGREAAGDAVKGIYRFFAMVLTPPALLSKASQMWSSLYNRGDMRVEDQTSSSARIRILNFPSEVAGCSRITGWMERMAELTGAKQVKVEQTQCYAKGAPHCEWTVRWS